MVEALIILAIAILCSLAWLWAGGIDYMKENHPEYKGEDFFNEEDKNETQ
jgi:lipopolysaccharide export system protein LptC